MNISLPNTLKSFVDEQVSQGSYGTSSEYLREPAEQAAYGFIDAREDAYAHLGRHPATGSPRYAHELNLPGLRFWPLTRYPGKRGPAANLYQQNLV